MNWVDGLIIVALGVTTFFGFKWGLLKSVVPLLGVILAIALAGILHESLADSLDFLHSESWANIVAFAIVFVGVFLVVYIVATVLHKIATIMFLGWVDRSAGAAFGLMIGWLICSTVMVLAARYAALPVNVPDIPASQVNQWVDENINGARHFAYKTIDGSNIATFQIKSFPVILGLLPGDFDSVKEFFGN